MPWPDRRSGRDEIYVAYSRDKGKTWSKPIAINDGREAPPARGPDHLLPVIAVNPAGIVGVVWQDRRDHPDNLGYWVRFTASLDGGDTWLPSVRVSEKPHTISGSEVWPISGGASAANGILSVEIGYNSFDFSGGHYSGLAVTPDRRFHPTWVDNRTGVPQIWSAPVLVPGRVVKNGAAELSGLTEVADKLTLSMTNLGYDAKSGVLTAMATLKNTSIDTIRGPFKVRVLAVRSELAAVRILDADNGLAGAGALWDFSSPLPGAQLLPGARSIPRKLRFQLSDVRSFRDEDEFRLRLVTLEARVLAPPSRGSTATRLQ